MNKTTTHNHLLPYLYNELSPSKRAEFELRIIQDAALYDEKRQLERAIQALNTHKMQPSAEVDGFVLAYAAF